MSMKSIQSPGRESSAARGAVTRFQNRVQRDERDSDRRISEVRNQVESRMRSGLPVVPRDPTFPAEGWAKKQ